MSNNKRSRQLLDKVEAMVAEAGLSFRIEYGGKHHKIVVANGLTERKTPYTISKRKEHDVYRMKIADVARIIRELRPSSPPPKPSP